MEHLIVWNLQQLNSACQRDDEIQMFCIVNPENIEFPALIKFVQTPEGILIVPFDLSDVTQYVYTVQNEIGQAQRPGIEGHEYAEAKEDIVEQGRDEAVDNISTEDVGTANS